MTPTHPPNLVVETAAKTSHVCLLLHGGGGSPEEFKVIVPSITPHNLGIRYVMPYAPEIALTLFGKQQMRAWYDVVDADLESQQDLSGIATSLQAVLALIETEYAQGTPYDKILVGGFSQGGVVALLAALHAPKPLAAAFCLSGYLPRGALPESTRNQKTAVFIAHGSDDDLVPLSLAKQACADLAGMGLTLTCHEYSMAHQVCKEELRALREWLALVYESSPQPGGQHHATST